MGLDEAHAAHVGGEVVDHLGALGGGAAGLEQGEIAHLVLDARMLLVPLGERLDVDGADLLMTALLQDAHQMAADEATGTGYDHEIILGHAEPFDRREGCLSDFSTTCDPHRHAARGWRRKSGRLREPTLSVKPMRCIASNLSRSVLQAG